MVLDVNGTAGPVALHESDWVFTRGATLRNEVRPAWSETGGTYRSVFRLCPTAIIICATRPIACGSSRAAQFKTTDPDQPHYVAFTRSVVEKRAAPGNQTHVRPRQDQDSGKTGQVAGSAT
jgi:hypothetical protein